MRIIPAIVAVALIPSLAGCGEGSAFDNGMRASFRDNAVQTCVDESRQQQTQQTAGVDWPRLCACGIDRYMEGRATWDLAVDTNPDEDRMRAAMTQCVQEIAPGALNQ